MRITEAQLRRIIRNEIRRNMLREGRVNEDWRGTLKKGAKYAAAAALGAGGMYGAQHADDMRGYASAAQSALSLPSNEADEAASVDAAIDYLRSNESPYDPSVTRDAIRFLEDYAAGKETDLSRNAVAEAAVEHVAGVE
jgi:hypothetical protein